MRSVPEQAATERLADRPGCWRATWFFVKLPFMLLRVVPHLGDVLRHEAATDTGSRARSCSEQLVPAQDKKVIAAVLSAIVAHDPGLDVRATTDAVVGAREVVNRSRESLDPSGARLVMSEGLWRVFCMLLDARRSHGVSRQGISMVTSASVASAVRDQVSEELRVRLTCEGERCEIAEGSVIRGRRGRRAWSEDWTIRRSATARTVPNGGVLDGRCPQCGAPLKVDVLGSCSYCKALALTGGHDWVVWSIEEEPW
jgi:hypothetical protein